MKLKLVEHDLLLLPGIDGTGAMFGPLLTVVPAEFAYTTVLFPNQERHSYKQLLASIRSAYKWDRPLLVVADCFSGPLALEFAAAQPESVQAVVLVSSFITNPLSPWMTWGVQWASRWWIQKFIKESVIRRYFLGEDAPDPLVETFKQALLSVSPEVLTHRLRQVLEADARVALQNCRRPILYLLGEQDKIMGRRGWEGISACKAGVTTTSIDGPHMLLQRKPREVFTAIDNFLQTLHTAIQIRVHPESQEGMLSQAAEI